MYIVRQEVLCYLAELECRAGRWERAVRFADESMDIVQETGQAATQSHAALFNQALARALLGRIDEAREQATTGVQLAEANDDRFSATWNRAVLGFIDLSIADLEGARRHLEPAVAWLDRLHAAEPGIIPCVPDLVEALIGLGQIGEAERHLRRLEEQAEALDRVWARATALRCRALIAAAAGDLDAAQRAAEASVGLLEGYVQPFETARSLLVLGQIHRRAKRKRLAREYLGRARGSVPWLGREALGGPRQRRARADRRSTVDAVRAHRDRAEHRLAGRPRVHEPGGRRRAVHQREHRPGEPQAGLPEARRSITDGAGGPDRSALGGLIRRDRRIKRTRPGGSRGASRP